MQSEGPWCIVSQLIRVCSEEVMAKERAEEGRKGGKKGVEGGGHSSKFNNSWMCIPGTTVYRSRRGERQEQHFHHSPWEREEGGRENILATALTDRQTYRVLSMYSVHRINPQCVLTNITQLPPDWLVSVREARSAPVQPPPIPAHRHWNRRTNGLPECFYPSGYTFACSKNQTFYRWTEDSCETVVCSLDLMLSSEVGMGGSRCRSYTIKLEIFG